GADSGETAGVGGLDDGAPDNSSEEVGGGYASEDGHDVEVGVGGRGSDGGTGGENAVA
ncbi:MAG: hypothetical protein GY772_01790, partial [bacterium]|nr:hypothetical protein [bacterium]